MKRNRTALLTGLSFLAVFAILAAAMEPWPVRADPWQETRRRAAIESSHRGFDGYYQEKIYPSEYGDLLVIWMPEDSEPWAIVEGEP